MAYTIQIHDKTNNLARRDRILTYLQERSIKERFQATLTPFTDNKGNPCIQVKPVRLIKAKPYCGNHPGPCEINPFLGQQKKNTMKYLEWDDWVRFHGLVNRVLNRFKVNAEVWSTPQDVRGKMWIRRNNKPRLRYDYTEHYNNIGRPIRIWNTGDETQF